MGALNALLLVWFSFALRRAVGHGVALGALLFLAIDPTVAAHLPVVMTDLPVSLLCASAVVFSVRAFRDWQWFDLIACSLSLGLALATKHSAPVMLIFMVLSGALLAFFQPIAAAQFSRPSRFARLLGVVAGSLFVLWDAYFSILPKVTLDAKSSIGRSPLRSPMCIRSLARCFTP